MARIITQDSLREQIQKAGKPLDVQYAIGEMVKTLSIPRDEGGKLRPLVMDRPVGEFLGSSAQMEELAEVYTVQIEGGREEHPVLYKPLFQTITNPNLPKIISSGFEMFADVVWLKHMEGQEVRFGTTRGEMGPTVPMVTYSAGFEWDEDIEEYNEGWRVELANTAMGNSYNALLNHIHLSPLIQFDYTTPGNLTTIQTSPSGERLENIRLTLREALRNAALKEDDQGRKSPIRPTTIICNLATAYDVNDALSLIGNTSSVSNPGTNDLFLGPRSDTAGPNPSVNQLSTIIVYDGDHVQMGNLRWDYAGMADDELLLVQPRKNMIEYIKHDMRVTTERPSDLTRLVIETMVARTRRGMVAVPESAIWKVTL